MRHLISTVETYRVENENEVEQLVNEAKNDTRFSLSKYNREYKSQTAKGELVQEWYRVTLTKKFTDEKEPGISFTVDYDEE